MTFEDWCKRQGIELRPWQKAASSLFFSAVPQGPVGKTFLLDAMQEFVSEHGNEITQ